MLTVPNITVFCKGLRQYKKCRFFKDIFMSSGINPNAPMIIFTINISSSHIPANFSRN